MTSCRAGEPKSQVLKCTKEEAHGGGTATDWHKALLQSMMQSRFCMIVPGDSQSSERLTDAFVAGRARPFPVSALHPCVNHSLLWELLRNAYLCSRAFPLTEATAPGSVILI